MEYRMKHLLLTAVLLAVTSLSHAIPTIQNDNIIIEHDDFDGNTTIYTKGLTIQEGKDIWDFFSFLHLEYTNKKPNHVTVKTTVFGPIKNNSVVKQLAIKADGKIKTYNALGDTAVGSKMFSHDFTLPIKELQRLNNAQSIQIRIVTNNGNFDGVLKDNSNPNSVAQTFADFNKAIQANKLVQK